MKKIRKCTIISLLFPILLLFLSSCAASHKDNEKVNVRIAYFPNMIHTQALVMKHQKTLETKWAENCDVSWISFNAGPSEIEALFAGEIDIGYIGPVPALNANAKSGGDIKIISNATNAGAVFLVRNDSGISSISDLSGKKIAVPQLGNTQHLCLLNLLKSYDLKPADQGGDVIIHASANADIVNLMDNKSIDGAVVPEPWGTTMENNGNVEILLDYDELYLDGDYPTALVVATNEFLEKHPDLASDFLEIHQETTKFIQEQPEEMQTIVNEEILAATGKSLDSDTISRAFSRIKATDAINTSAIMQFADISKDAGFTNTIPEENDVFYYEPGQ